MSVEPKVIRLAPGEKVIAVVPERCSGPGWANAPTWVYVATNDGRLRQECIQPEERTPQLHALYHAGEAMCASLLASVPQRRAKPPNAALKTDALRYREIMADVHTCGPTCRKTPVCAERADLREENERLCAQVDALQARMDALMLEFCPDEMTEEQKETWARHQRPATANVTAAVLATRSE